MTRNLARLGLALFATTHGLLAQGFATGLREMIPPGAGLPIAAADFDVDGDVDLLTSWTGIYLNDGNGRFPSQPVSGGFAFPAGTPVADFNGDGIPDVAFGIGGMGLVLWLGVGGGVLVQSPAPLPALPPGPAVTAIGAADVNGDGNTDLVIGRAGAPLVLWLSSGPATFTDASAQLPATVLHPRQLMLLDFDGDGDRDLLLINYSTGAPPPAGNRILMLNDGSGFFAVAWSSPGTGSAYDTSFVVGNVNGDQLPDVAFASNVVSLVVNAGGGAFGSPSVVAMGRPALIDVTGDGLDELVVASPTAGILVHSIGPGGMISAPVQTLKLFATALVAADFDGDGDRDLIVAATQANRLLLNTGQGLAEIPAYLSTGQWSRLLAGDLDGDGDTDLIGYDPYTYYLNALVVAWNNGDGQLDAGPHPPCTGFCPAYPGNVVIHLFDADGDGDLDLYLMNCVVGPMPSGDRLMLNTGSGFSASIPYSDGGTTGALAIASGDLDGDGDQDLVISRFPWGNYYWLPAQVFFNSGSGSFGPPVPLPVANWSTDLKLVDVDADGDLDLVEANSFPGSSLPTSALLLNDGAGGFTPAVGFPGMAASYVEAGDLDGDGDPDLLLDNHVLLNSGNGAFTPGPVLSFPATFYRTYLVDADADGDLDVLEGGRIYPNNGSATFGATIIVAYGQWAAIADFDRDGDQDFVTPAGFPTMLTGTARQLVRGLPARPGRIASFDVWGPALGTWTLFSSSGPASLALPQIGTVWIDPAAAWIVGSGTFDAVGRAAWSAAVPTTPSLVGQSYYLQALVFGGPVPKLTGREVATVTVY